MIERQLQTAVNNIVKWCDSNGHSISASKSCCVHFCRKRGIHPDPEIRIRYVQLPVVPDVRFLGVIFQRPDHFPSAYFTFAEELGVRYRVLLATKLRRHPRQCNEQSDSAARSATTHLPLGVPLSDIKRVILHHIFKISQELWSQQLDNKRHSMKPVIGAWSVMPMRRTDFKLSRLRIGHTRFTHKHLLLGEDAPECPSCKPELLYASKGEILEGLSDQGVTQVRRITILKDSTRLPTKHIILSFNSPKLPTTIKAGYLSCKIRPYIPNPLCCFKCQRFGYSQTSCRGQLTCSRCASFGHSSTDCTLEPKCVNCTHSHPSDSKLCQKWKLEKQIQEVKTINNISYFEARRLIVPQLTQTYAQAARPSTISSASQTNPNLSNIICPPLQCLTPISSKNPLPSTSSSVSTFSTSSSSTQDNLLPSLFGILPTIQRVLIGQRKGSFRGRVCGGRVACVVGDGSKERSAESGPKGRRTWLRMARRWGLLQIEKSSLGSALDRARQHVMGVSRCLVLKNPPAVTLCTLEKCGNSWPGGGRDGTRSNPCCQKNGDNKR
ncbi:RNase H domain-containing protein [Trichonephila clavipes]|nr:RNase H domain-containing protein [Trichonephila clavipes]